MVLPWAEERSEQEVNDSPAVRRREDFRFRMTVAREAQSLRSLKWGTSPAADFDREMLGRRAQAWRHTLEFILGRFLVTFHRGRTTACLPEADDHYLHHDCLSVSIDEAACFF